MALYLFSEQMKTDSHVVPKLKERALRRLLLDVVTEEKVPSVAGPATSNFPMAVLWWLVALTFVATLAVRSPLPQTLRYFQ